MPTTFRRPFEVLERQFGTWTEGCYSPAETAPARTVWMTIQEVSTGERNQVEAQLYGRRVGRILKIYTDEQLRSVRQAAELDAVAYTGDLVVFEGQKYLLFGESNFTMLSRTRSTPVSHWRYIACEMIEQPREEGAP